MSDHKLEKKEGDELDCWVWTAEMSLLGLLDHFVACSTNKLLDKP